MNWQTLSLIACLLYGITGIACSKAAKIQGSCSTMLIYGIAMLSVAILPIALGTNQPRFLKQAVFFALIAGVCGALAIGLQFHAFEHSLDKYPWIILIGSLNPAIVLAFSMATGARLTLTQWLGVGCAILAIVLINLPAKTISTG
jgi:drug/metabolite transporter (DMT)-like permease